ncbi:MAG: T9SS type A sorting domain-containing protein [Flavobacteriales bacterium]
MKAFYTLLILLIPFFGFGQSTYVPDDNFEQALIDLGYDDILDNYVQTNNINQILELDLPWFSNITSLIGIEDFTQLTSLKCKYNQITSLNLSNNSLLTFVDCSNNQINYIAFDNNNNVLEELNCSRNNLSNLNIYQNFNTTPNYSLKHLNIEDNLFENININSYVALETLLLGKNKLKNIDLSANINLKQFSSNDVFTGDFPNDYYNQLNSISFFNNTNIETITITNGGYLPDSNKVYEILLPYEAENLTSINLSNNLIECLDVSMFPNLQTVSLENNQLSQLNLQNGNQYLFPTINNNNLSCVEVTNLGIANNWNNVDSFTAFSLDCGSNYNCNQLTYVPDDNFEEFLESNGYGNGIDNDDFVFTSSVESILTLDVNDLGIYDLTGIEDFTFLEIIGADNNSISYVDFSNNLNLEILSIQNNQLNSLDLSANYNLTLINLYGNVLTSLDLRNSNNQNINFINVGSAPFSNPNLYCISVDDLNYSNNNWLNVEANFVFGTNNYFSNGCSFNCSNSEACIDPLDGSGTYDNLQECEADCNSVEPTWDCGDLNACYELSDGSGNYQSLEECEAVCTTVIEDSWNCVNNSCIDPMDGTGEFSSLIDCESYCVPTWGCWDFLYCIEITNGTGNFYSLEECEDFCISTSTSENFIDLNIYPNPSSNIFNIEFNSDSETEIIVNNILGEQVYYESIKSVGEFYTQIDLSNNSKGIYNLTIKTYDGISNHKLILQ